MSTLGIDETASAPYNPPVTRDELKEWRKTIAMTQGKLAEWLGVQLNTVNRWENGPLDVPHWLPLALCEIERRVKAERKREEKKRAAGQ